MTLCETIIIPSRAGGISLVTLPGTDFDEVFDQQITPPFTLTVL
jgi:hypothetical protein